MVNSPKRVDWHLWKNIQQTALHISRKVKPALKGTSRLKQETKVPPLDLPSPGNILEVVSGYDLPEDTRNRLLGCLIRRVGDLQTSYRQRYQQACSTLSTTPTFEHDVYNIRNAFLTLYQKQGIPVINSLIESTQSSLEQHCKRVDRKPVFNHKAIPLLETYFQSNAYPSTAHKAVLAEKSIMTSRQIEVWFQNHRSRARKEGKHLHRATSNTVLQSALRFVECNSENEQQSSDSDFSDDDHDKIILNSSSDSLLTARPSHAFPTPFPPPSNPFPTIDGRFRFPITSWRRTPVTVPLNRNVVDMDELTTMFALKLNLRDSLVKFAKKDGHRCSSRSRQWFSSLIHFPPPAPHPALVRPNTRSTSTPALCMNTAQPPLPLFSQTSLLSSSLSSQYHLRHRKEYPFPNSGRPNLAAGDLPWQQIPFTSPQQSRSSSVSSLSSIEPQTPPLPPCQPSPETMVSAFSDDSWFDIFMPLDGLSNASIYGKSSDLVTYDIPTFSL